ncbi:MAG: nucleoside deaminase, partial [Actinobacteria bacterium]|nr:nucleoside deaminase [Actinomycetota bacterium]
MRDAFDIPHDLTILAEVFRCDDGGYAPTNAYWQSYSLMGLIEQATEEQ